MCFVYINLSVLLGYLIDIKFDVVLVNDRNAFDTVFGT